MPSLIITINTPLVDVDGVDHRIRKEVDVWPSLATGVQTALGALQTRLLTILVARYGANTTIEGMRYEA